MPKAARTRPHRPPGRAGNHLPDRQHVLADWRRLLRPGGRILYTNPTIVTGPLSADEIDARASIGHFTFTPPHEDERALREAGFELERREDTTDNVALVARRSKDARARHRDELLADEGAATFRGVQRFLSTVHALAAQRRLSRHTFLARRAEGNARATGRNTTRSNGIPAT